MNVRRIISALLAVVLFAGCLPLGAFAEETDRLDTPQITVKNVTGSGRILVTWEAVENAASYKVYRASAKDGSYSSLGSTGALKFTDTTAVSGKTYYYKVKAIAGETGTNSDYSDVFAGTYKLKQPELTLSGTAEGKVKLSWKAVSGAQSYDLFRSTDGENWSRIKNVTGTSYDNASVTAGTIYYYQVQAIASKEAANSALSEADSITAPLARPTVTAKTDSESGKPVISWEAVEDAQEYEIFRAAKKDGTYQSLGTTDRLSFTDGTAVGGKTYYYRVTARSADAVSLKSSAKSVMCALAAPTVTVTNNAAGKPVISWDKQDAEDYKVYRATSKTGEFTLVKTTSKRTYTDTSATAGKIYYYKVKAIGESTKANSAFSAVVSGACKLAQPVLTLSNDTATGHVKLSWKAVSGAQSYDLYRSTDKENWKLIKNVTGTSYTNASVTAGTTYYYQLQAIAAKEAANSMVSEAVGRTAKLEQPVAALKTDSVTGRITVSWESVEGAQGYEVWRASSKSGEYTLRDTVTGTRLTDDSGTAAKTYYYKVKALGEKTAANSAWSKVVSATRKLARPTVTVKNASNTGKIILSWDSQKKAASYDVYRSDSQDGPFKKVKSTSSTSYTDTTVTAQKTYYYKVRAVASVSSGTSAFSEVMKAVCRLPRPTVTLSNSADTGAVTLSWKAVSGATGYSLYRSDSEKGEYTLVGSTTATRISDEDAPLGVTCYYKVVAEGKKDASSSAMSKAVSGLRKLERPVVTLENDRDTGKIILSWNGIEDARRYEVYRSTSKTGEYTLIKVSSFSQLTDTSAGAGKTYYYKVRALNDNKKVNSAYSTPQSCVCTLARAKVEAGNDESTGKVKLTWKAVKNVRTYSIYRATEEDGEYKLVKTSTSTSYTDTASYVGKTYYYKVRALANSSAANAAYSKVVSATGKLAQPTIKLGSVTEEGTFKITWSAVTGAKSYDLYRSTDMENWTLLKSTTGRSHTTRMPESGITYYFRLQAIASKEAANSAFSAVKNVYAQLEAPVISTSVDPDLGRARISWDAVDNAVSYAVYRSISRSGDYSKLGSTENLSYTDPTGRAGKTYYYKVRAIAFNTSANSPLSAAASGASRYVEDMNLSIQLNANGKPYLTWGQLKGVEQYRIYRSTEETKGFEKISSTEYFSYTNNTVAEGVTYYYKIKAVDDEGTVIQTSDTLSVTPSLTQEEQLKTRYIAVPKVKLHTKPESDSPEIPLRYMDKIRLGNAVITRENGTWYRVYYQGDLYYLLIKDIDTELTRTKSDYTYTANTKFQQRLLNEAYDLAFNQKTVYLEGGCGDLTADGAMGFDCSGMVSYLLNQTMRKWVPVYTVSSSMGILSQTKDLYNIGYRGAFSAHRITRIEDLQPGDVLFFRSQLDSDLSAELGHCSIYLGNREFIHCTSVWEDSVCIMPLTGDFENNLLEVRRFLPETVTSAKETVRVTKACKVYERRNDASPVLESLAKSDKVTILYITDKWAYVKTPAGNYGFVKAQYIPAK